MLSKETKETIGLFGLVGGLLLLLGCLAMTPWVISSYFEATAFNHATGADVSTWDAMWIELRVEGKGK